MMRTTVDLPANIHALAKALASDRGESMTATVVELIRRGLNAEATSEADIRLVNGFPVVFGGPPTTSEDVAAMDDE